MFQCREVKQSELEMAQKEISRLFHVTKIAKGNIALQLCIRVRAMLQKILVV